MHLYIGHALYKLDLNQRRSFKTQQLIDQVTLARTNSRAQGSIYFRAKAFNKNHQNFQQTFRKTIYQYPALIPTMPWIDSIPPSTPEKLKLTWENSSVMLSWSEDKSNDPMNKAHTYAVYRTEGNLINPELNAKNLIKISRTNQFLDFNTKQGKSYTYYVTSFDRMHNESLNNVSRSITIE